MGCYLYTTYSCLSWSSIESNDFQRCQIITTCNNNYTHIYGSACKCKLFPFLGRVTEVFKPIAVEHGGATYDVVHLSSEEQLVTMTSCV